MKALSGAGGDGSCLSGPGPSFLKLREDFEPENTTPNTVILIFFSQSLLHHHSERFSVSWRKNVH